MNALNAASLGRVMSVTTVNRRLITPRLRPKSEPPSARVTGTRKGAEFENSHLMSQEWSSAKSPGG